MKRINIWTVYDSPADYPGMYVVRHSHIANDGRVIMDARPLIVADSYAGAKASIPIGLQCVPRDLYDEPQIREIWI